MAPEEKKDEATEAAAENEEAAEESKDEAAEAADAPAEKADEAPAEKADEAPAEDAAADEGPAAEKPADEGGDEEAPEELTRKQKRKLERSRASGPPGPQLTPEQRAEQRGERRRLAAQERQRHRRRRREKRGTGGSASLRPASGEASPRGTGTPPAERRPGTQKVRQGTVVSTKTPKTITVRVEIKRRHPTYEKVVRRSSTLRAHDEGGDAHEGDVVRVVETRPLSRTKRWRLLEVVERAR